MLRRLTQGFSARQFTTVAEDSLVTLQVQEKVAELKLNDPEKLNAMTVDMGEEFLKRIDEIKRRSEEISAVVLTGSGRAFSAGGDLKFLHDRYVDTPYSNSTTMRDFYSRFLAIRNVPVPVIAAINGPAIGAGLCVALACDMRVVSRKAKLGVTFTGIGIHPGMGSTFFLPRLIGPQQAAKMLLTGEVIDGSEALARGLAVEATEDGASCVDRAFEIASKICDNSPTAVQTTVRSLRMQHDEQLDRALWREADAQVQTYAAKGQELGLE